MRLKITEAQFKLLKAMPLHANVFMFTSHEGTKKACFKRGWIARSDSKIELTADGKAALTEYKKQQKKKKNG
jgi:hypothetical protein